jgi:hypothetical protein
VHHNPGARQMHSLTVIEMVRGVRSAKILQLYAALPSWQLWKLVSWPQLMCGPPCKWVGTLGPDERCCTTSSAAKSCKLELSTAGCYVVPLVPCAFS